MDDCTDEDIQAFYGLSDEDLETIAAMLTKGELS